METRFLLEGYKRKDLAKALLDVNENDCISKVAYEEGKTAPTKPKTL